MDLISGRETGSEDKYKLYRLDSSDFSARLVPLHTDQEKSVDKQELDKGNDAGVEDKGEDEQVFSKSEYTGLASSTTSFKRWHSQTTLLDDLLNEGLSPSKACRFLKTDTFGPLADLLEDKKVVGNYELLFDQLKGTERTNNMLVTFLLNNYSDSEGVKSLMVSEEMSESLMAFKKKYFELVESDKHELRFKRALLTVAFNHYGKSKVPGYMTLEEFMAMLEAHKVFTNDTVSTFVFDSMDRKHKSMITLSEFVSGMLSCSPKANQNLNTAYGKLRLQHMFRAYDINRVGYLDKNSVELMLEHLGKVSRDPEYQGKKSELSEKLLAMFNGKLSYDSFYYCVENNLIKDTKFLFRSNLDMAGSVMDALSTTLHRVVEYERPKTLDMAKATLFSGGDDDPITPSVRDRRDVRTSKASPNMRSPEQSRYSRSEPVNINRSSIWSHTPRIYSEFTHARLPSRDVMSSFSHESTWSNSFMSQNSKTDTAMDRVSKMYYGKDGETTTAEEMGNKTPVNSATPKSPTPSESSHFASAEKPVLERTEEVPREFSPKEPYLLVSDSLQSKSEPEETEKNNLEELLKEYEDADKHVMDNDAFTPIKDTEIFEDVFENETQLLEQYDEANELFTPVEAEDDLVKVDERLNKLEQVEPPKTNEVRDLVHEPQKVETPLGAGNTKCDPLADVLEDLALKPKETEVKPEEKKAKEDVGPAISGTHRDGLDESTLECVANQLSRRYKSKFLVFKGLLIDNTVAKSVLTNFMTYSMGGCKDTEFKWCTYSDTLQLCDAVCSLLRKEDSLLELNGDFQVFGSLNGDLSCLLDLFNTYGWPMVSKKPFEHEVDKALPNFSNTNWVDFQYSYLFMGGFVSDVCSFSLEFVLLLFSLKVMFPYHVYFVRSSKDERNSTNNAGFYDEIYRKLSENCDSLKIFNDETLLLQCSKELFHRVNDVFEFMSVAAVLNQEVLCVDRLTRNFSHNKLANLPKPLTVSTCDQEQVYDLLFNPHSHDRPEHLRFNTMVYPYNGVNGHDSGGADAFKLVVCSSDDLDSGYKYLNNRLVLLSTNFTKKKAEKVATVLELNRGKVVHKSLKM